MAAVLLQLLVLWHSVKAAVVHSCEGVVLQKARLHHFNA
jgi:hypothetical protein